MIVLYWVLVLVVALPTFVLAVAAWKQHKYPQALVLTGATVGVGMLLNVVHP